MRIWLDGSFYINANDQYNYELVRVAGAKGKLKKPRVVGYYGRHPKGLRQCVRRYLEEQQCSVEENDIIKYIEELIDMTERTAETISITIEGGTDGKEGTN